jgi:prepilin-type N-terminal cleavage/methylation domain-containing protein
MHRVRNVSKRLGKLDGVLPSRGCLSDAGFSLIEVIVAIVLLTVISLPVALVLENTGRTASYAHLQAEADDLASQNLEQQVQEAQSLPSYGDDQTTTTNVVVGTTKFVVKLVVGISTPAGTSVCSSPPGTSQTEEIISATATVTWSGAGGSTNVATGGGPVSLTTELAPLNAGDITSGAGEIAVPVETLSSTLDTTDVEYFLATGTYEGTDSTIPAVPSGETVDPPAVASVDGCAVITGLDSQAGWVYQVEVQYCGVNSVVTNCTSVSANNNAQMVDYDENGAQWTGLDPGAPGIPLQDDITVSGGAITVLTPFYLAEAATVPFTFATDTFSAAGALTTETPNWIPSDVVVGVQNGHLQCDTEDNTCLLGTPPATYPTGGSDLYLYPYTDGYTVYSGDEPEGNPSAESPSDSTYYFPSGYTQPTAEIPLTTPSVADTSEASINIPLYYAQLTVKCSSFTSFYFTGLTFTETDGNLTSYADAPSGLKCEKSGGTVTSYTFTVGLPLGQYQIGATISSGTPAVTANKYIWVTPFGMCSSGTAATQAAIPTTDAPITNCASSVGTWTVSTAATPPAVTVT